MEFLRREAGLITILDPESDKPVAEVMTVQCVHCGKHVPVADTRYSGLDLVRRGVEGRKSLGYCARCDGFTCGERCEQCVPLEQWLDNVENQLPDGNRPVQIFVPPTYPTRSRSAAAIPTA